jgi:poly-gamma-glutamate capsule biosynthesis protein CapA/YwtB (metallophosphatase superfamily)
LTLVKKIILGTLLIFIFLTSTGFSFFFFHHFQSVNLPLLNPLISSFTSPNPDLIGERRVLPSISLDSIFADNHNWINNFPQDQLITLITTGDVIPARSVNWKMTHYNDFTYPFAKTADFLKTADLTLINLEAPLVPNCPITNEGMIFCGSLRFVEGLNFAGVDVANLANNHAGNWGQEGLTQTVDLLTKNGILTTGFDNQLTTKTVKGLKIGFLGFNLLDLPRRSPDLVGTEAGQPDKPDQLIESVRQAKTQVDFLVVSCHWGAEYQRLPAPETVGLAHQMIEAGADLIVGNHPHWFQPIEIYKDKFIIYAHGNFIFDQEWSQETKTGFITKISIYQRKIIDVQILPVFIKDYSQPFFLEGQDKEKVLEELKNISFKLAGIN